MEEEIAREWKQFLELTHPLKHRDVPHTWLKVKPCEPVKSQYMTPLVFVLVCGVAVCNCQTAAGQTVECKRKRDQTE